MTKRKYLGKENTKVLSEKPLPEGEVVVGQLVLGRGTAVVPETSNVRPRFSVRYNKSRHEGSYTRCRE